MYKRLLFFISSFYLLLSCNQDPLEIDISNIDRKSEILRFEKAFFNTDTSNFSADLQKVQQEFPVFFLSGQSLEDWYFQRSSERQLEIYKATMNEFPDLQSVEEKLDLAMKHFYYYYPTAPEFQFYSYVSNLDFSYPILVADSLCFIALDLYLGPNKAFYDLMPEYLAFYRQKKFLARDCMEAIGREVIPPPSTSNPSLLELMIYHGKILYFLEATMPSEERNDIIKYPAEKFQFTQSNEKNIWAYFIENDLLFSTGNEAQKKFIDPAPFSKFGMKFDSETPGRIGQWLGWQIVRSYAQNNRDVSFQQIMGMQNARKFLRESAYKPN